MNPILVLRIKTGGTKLVGDLLLKIPTPVGDNMVGKPTITGHSTKETRCRRKGCVPAIPKLHNFLLVLSYLICD